MRKSYNANQGGEEVEPISHHNVREVSVAFESTQVWRQSVERPAAPRVPIEFQVNRLIDGQTMLDGDLERAQDEASLSVEPKLPELPHSR